MREPTLQEEMDLLRREAKEMGWRFVEALGIPRLVAWLDMMILRWRLMKNIRNHHRRYKNLRVGEVEDFLKEIGMSREQFKSIRKDIR